MHLRVTRSRGLQHNGDVASEEFAGHWIKYVRSVSCTYVVVPASHRQAAEGHEIHCMEFEIIGEINDATTIAAGASIRERLRLQRLYGKGRWRKRKGFAKIEVGGVIRSEIHWYESSGIGRRELKVKRFLDTE